MKEKSAMSLNLNFLNNNKYLGVIVLAFYARTYMAQECSGNVPLKANTILENSVQQNGERKSFNLTK